MTSRLIRREACPDCRSKGEDQAGDNLGVFDDGHAYCFKCTYFVPPNNREDFVPLNDTTFTYEFLPHRGLTKDTLKFFDIQTKVDTEGKPISVGFKYPNASYKIRNLEKKEYYTTGDISNAGLYGRDKFPAGSHKYVTITEGEYDAASLYQVLRSPCVSVGSGSTAVRDCAADRSWLQSFDRIYLAFDDDPVGREAARRVAKLFDFNKVFQVKFAPRKDANEFLQHDESEALRNIWHNAKRYAPESIKSTFAEFDEILREKPKSSVSYPFRTLNEMTYGIRTGEVVLLTAQEKVGKTSIMHAIEYHLLKETNDAIAAIYLEEPKRQHLQALAGLELRKPVHLPDCRVQEGEVLGAIKKLVVRDDRLHVYSHFGSDDPDALLDTIRFLVSGRACRYVLFDHITMSVTGLAGENNERRALEYLATRLAMMVRELDFSLIMVSHVNDHGQTRGSHYITKVADITIQAFRDTVNIDPTVRNTIDLVIPYNRFAARSGPAGKLRMDPLTYVLHEVYDEEAANDNPRDAALVPSQAA